MLHLEHIPADSDRRALFDAVLKQCYPPESPRWRSGHEPDAKYLDHLLVLLRDDAPVARCARYVNPHYPGALLVGSYECVDDDGLARTLFAEVERVAQAKGLDRLIGPMDGSTWNSHRFSDADDRPRFFTEPYHHAYYPAQWRANGFTPLAHYASHKDNDLRVDEDGLTAKSTELETAGIHIRMLDKARMNEELARIGAFSIAAFRENFLYAPITVDDFVAKYARIAPVLVPELVLLAEDASGTLLGLILALPDLNEPDPTRRAVIVKTVAATKDASVEGLGRHLMRRVEQAAAQLGHRAAIHAFMAVRNRSSEGSRKLFGGEPFGTYTLYEKRL